MKLYNIAITFKALERELNLPEGVLVVGVAQHPTLNQFVVKIACDTLPDGMVPESFAEIGDAFRQDQEREDRQERESILRESIHF